MPLKLIEVALPLEAINAAAATEKSIRHGHPSTLHLWWARRPLAACRAVLFASIVDDPSAHPDRFPDEAAQKKERDRLFGIIERMVKWENSNASDVLREVRAEIRAACVPAPPARGDDFSTLAREAARFDGYKWMAREGRARQGDETMALQQLYEELKANFERTREFGGSLDELRAALFYLGRNWNHGSAYDENSAVDIEIARALVAEMRRRWDAATPELPPVLDPFSGGGSIPLEAQRLGLEAHGSDLNPVAVLISKALIEIPPLFADAAPVNPDDRIGRASFSGAMGLAADVRYYGAWMREQARGRIGHLYPDATLPDGSKATVIAWLWARTVPCPNPACGAAMPLVRSFALSTKKNKAAWVEPIIEQVPVNPKFVVAPQGAWEQSNSPETATVHASGDATTNESGGDPKFVVAPQGAWQPNAASDTRENGGSNVSHASGDATTNLGATEHAGATRNSVRFTVVTGDKVPAKSLEGTVNRQGATCICCGTTEKLEYLRQQGKAGNLSQVLMAIVAEGKRERIYLAPTSEHEAASQVAPPLSVPMGEMPRNPRWFSPPQYGMPAFSDLFTPRQLVALTNFSDLICEVQKQIEAEALAQGQSDDQTPLSKGGTGAKAYGEAVAVYLGFAISKLLDRSCSLVTWFPARDSTYHVFARHALPMTWDYAETNTLLNGSGSFLNAAEWVAEVVANSLSTKGKIVQRSATTQLNYKPIISTDPPYYDNIGYADLSDFFYVWLRRSIGPIFPELLSTLLTPKADELIASPYRHDGSRSKAEQFFENGLHEAFARMREAAHPDFPLTVYYAFKQSETTNEHGEASTGWETMLSGLIDAGFQVNGTWPMRSELANRMIARDANALASSVVLVCRPRDEAAGSISRMAFLRELRQVLPQAIRAMQSINPDSAYITNIAPVDFAQAVIGPGMGVFSKYAGVTEMDGTPLGVRAALGYINEVLDEVLSEQEGDTDLETRFALALFTQNGWSPAPYGEAETLANAKNVAVQSLVASGILESGGGKVRLIKREEFDASWNPDADPRLTVWEVMQHLAHALDKDGETGASNILRQLCLRNGDFADRARELAYRLFALCERKKWSSEAGVYNALIISWPEILKLSQGAAPDDTPVEITGSLFDD